MLLPDYIIKIKTLKYLIVIIPQGTIYFTSNGWIGRTSDQDVTENSVFLNI